MKLVQKIAIGYIRAKFKVLASISKKRAAEKALQLFCTPQYRNRKKLPKIFENAEKLHFQFEGGIVRGYRWNHPSEKKLQILHGFESSVINFDRYIRPLIKEGYEVLAFDAPAHGRSSGKQINVLIYKKLIQHIHNNYGPIKNYIAHSLGGLALSLEVEERKSNEDVAIVFIAPATETTTAIDSFFKFLGLDGEIRHEFDLLIEKMAGKRPSWFSITRAASKIYSRVLFVQDKDDDMTPLSDVQPIIEKKFPNFQFLISEGLGHRRIYRDNKTFKAILEFFS